MISLVHVNQSTKRIVRIDWPDIPKYNFVYHWEQLGVLPLLLLVWTCRGLSGLPPFDFKLLTCLRDKSPSTKAGLIFASIPSSSTSASWSLFPCAVSERYTDSSSNTSTLSSSSNVSFTLPMLLVVFVLSVGVILIHKTSFPLVVDVFLLDWFLATVIWFGSQLFGLIILICWILLLLMLPICTYAIFLLPFCSFVCCFLPFFIKCLFYLTFGSWSVFVLYSFALHIPIFFVGHLLLAVILLLFLPILVF